ncbi:DUF4870 domain-containing protein [Brevundimonas sp.]|uniref:DUF4870 domain-containing protein n=1 Tax=Brevundimonas sp. TaxID=1871086 RepID=UPI0035B0C1FC
MTYDPGPAPVTGDNHKTLTIIIYVLSLAGFVTGGITSIIALVIGLVKKNDVRGTIYESHFEFANWTNIWMLVAGIAIWIVGTLLMLVLIGFVVLPIALVLLAVWYGVRLILGLIKLMDNRPVDNPRGFLF